MLHRLSHCAVLESIHAHRHPNGNSKGEGGSESQDFKGKYEAKLEFPGRVGDQTKKNPLVGGVQRFTGTIYCVFLLC